MTDSFSQAMAQSSPLSGRLPLAAPPQAIRRASALVAVGAATITCSACQGPEASARAHGTSLGDILSAAAPSSFGFGNAATGGAAPVSASTSSTYPSLHSVAQQDPQRSVMLSPLRDQFGAPGAVVALGIEALPRIPEYRNEYRYAPVQLGPTRSESLYDAITGFTLDSDQLITLVAKHGARLLRKYETPQDEEANASVDRFTSVMSAARLKPFGEDSPLGPLRCDLRPRNIDSLDNFDIRVKVQWLLENGGAGGRIRNSIGITYDSGWDDGSLIMAYHSVTF